MARSSPPARQAAPARRCRRRRRCRPQARQGGRAAPGRAETYEPPPAPPRPGPSNYDAPGPVANTATPVPAPEPSSPAAIDEAAEEAAAAAEAANIGGAVSDYAGPADLPATEAERPLAEAGEGEAEGQEQAELDLETAARADGAGHVRQRAPDRGHDRAGGQPARRRAGRAGQAGRRADPTERTRAAPPPSARWTPAGRRRAAPDRADAAEPAPVRGAAPADEAARTGEATDKDDGRQRRGQGRIGLADVVRPLDQSLADLTRPPTAPRRPRAAAVTRHSSASFHSSAGARGPGRSQTAATSAVVIGPKRRSASSMPGNPSADGSPSRRARRLAQPLVRAEPLDPVAVAELDRRRRDAAAALEVGGEALQDRRRAEVDLQAREVEAAGLARGVQQGRRVVHPPPLEQDRLAQPPDEPCRVRLVGHGRDRQPRRMGRRRRVAHEHARVGGHPALGRGVHRLERQGGASRASICRRRPDDHEGERQPVAEFDLQAAELRLGRP